MPELSELAGHLILAGDERDEPLRCARLGVERDRHAVTLDPADGPDGAIDENRLERIPSDCG
jgi:hypothetical protein